MKTITANNDNTNLSKIEQISQLEKQHKDFGGREN